MNRYISDQLLTKVFPFLNELGENVRKKLKEIYRTYLKSLLNEVPWVSQSLSALNARVPKYPSAKVPERLTAVGARVLKCFKCPSTLVHSERPQVPMCSLSPQATECPTRSLLVPKGNLGCHWHYHWTENIPLKYLLSK